MRMALSVDLGFYSVNDEVAQAIIGGADRLRNMGATVEEVDLDWNSSYIDTWYDIWGVYLDACFARDFEKWRDRMDPLLVELIERGRGIDAVTYKKYEIQRTEQWHKLCDVFDRYDALLAPTMAQTAPTHDKSDKDFESVDTEGRLEALEMTCIFNNVSQCPAVSVPAGFSSDQLPIGMQIIGHRFSDLTVMKIAAALEGSLSLHQLRPPLGPGSA